MRKFTAIAVLACLGVFQGAPAHAHNSLTSTSPARGAVLTTSPTEVLLTFDLPFIGGQEANVVTVTNADGKRVDNNDSFMEANTLRATLQDLPTGTYTVSFRIVSEDGHPVSHSYQFGVTLPEPSASTSTPQKSPTPRATPHKTQHSSASEPSPSPSRTIESSRPTPSTTIGAVPSQSISSHIATSSSVQSIRTNLLRFWLIPTLLVTLGAAFAILRKRNHP